MNFEMNEKWIGLYLLWISFQDGGQEKGGATDGKR